jgi:DNA-binding IclR family transcriptional regulator
MRECEVVKPALAASRALQVIDFMSVHPGQSMSMTEISRALKINPASTLAVLASLTESGYVVRHPAHKTYTLGPALVAVGHSAMIQNPSLEAAREELRLISKEIQAQCAASVLTGDVMVAVVTEGTAQRAGTWTRVGERVPFAAPYGAPFAAFGNEGLRRTWMERKSGTPASAARVAGLHDALAEVRERGYAVWRESETREALARALWSLSDNPSDKSLRLEVDRLLDELSDGFVATNMSPNEAVDIAIVSVPVFSSMGGVSMVLTAFGFANLLGGEAISEVGARLRACAETIAARASALSTTASAEDRS